MISLFATVAPEAENLEKDHVAIVWLMCGYRVATVWLPWGSNGERAASGQAEARATQQVCDRLCAPSASGPVGRQSMSMWFPPAKHEMAMASAVRWSIMC